MSGITFLKGLLLNLKGEIQPRRREYLSKKEAYRELKLHTGQDFGDDFNEWEKWIQQHPTSIRTKDTSVDASKRVTTFLSKPPEPSNNESNQS